MDENKLLTELDIIEVLLESNDIISKRGFCGMRDMLLAQVKKLHLMISMKDSYFYPIVAAKESE